MVGELRGAEMIRPKIPGMFVVTVVHRQTGQIGVVDAHTKRVYFAFGTNQGPQIAELWYTDHRTLAESVSQLSRLSVN